MEISKQIESKLYMVNEQVVAFAVSAAVSSKEEFDNLVSLATIGLIKAVTAGKGNAGIITSMWSEMHSYMLNRGKKNMTKQEAICTLETIKRSLCGDCEEDCTSDINSVIQFIKESK